MVAETRNPEAERPENNKIREQQLIDIINNVPAGVCLYKWDGVKLHPIVASVAFSNLLGHDGKKAMEEVEGTDYHYVHPDDLPGLKMYLSTQLKNTDKELACQYRIWNTEKKQYGWLDVRGKSVAQKDGTILVYAVYSDIT